MSFANASLFTAEPRAIYGAIITADRLLYHSANILGRNPIAAQPLHTSSGLRQWPGEEVCWQETYLPDTAGPWHLHSPSVYGQGGGCVLLPSQQSPVQWEQLGTV